jgi:formylglycine-generating enzyme required for sulfatase activity
MISINGRLYGFSPQIISELPYGEYTITVEKPEYSRVVQQVIVNDVKPIKIELSLYSGKEIKLNSNPTGAQVFIEKELVGVTPLTLWLKYGTHLVLFEKDGLSLAENIVLFQSSRKNFSFELRVSNDPFHNQMVFVKGGTFRMGDSFGDGNKEEKPVHPVTVSDFSITKYEVTQAQWLAIMGSNPSHFAGCDNCPVERVSWLDVQEYIIKVNELTGKSYRLPTEAEWEYAARGGQESLGFRFAGKNNINFVSWFTGNSGNKTQPVGKMEPNELGLYDMSGNVWEWTYDWFALYAETQQINPLGPDDGDFKVVRGGSWYGYIGGSRVACRGSDDPSNKRSYIGFRLVIPVVYDESK